MPNTIALILYFARVEIALCLSFWAQRRISLHHPPAERFFTPLRSVQNDLACFCEGEKRSSCPCAVYLKRV